MTFLRSHRNLPLAALAASFALTLSAASVSAQQITYYDFDAPQANSGQISRDCSVGPGSALFCLNDGGNNALPAFLSDTYPASIDPNPTDNPPQSSTHFAAQMSQAGSQHSSLWFSVPQKVASGFTAWFAFKLTAVPGSDTTADGLAFVLQNASGPGYDGAGGCTSTGLGLTAVGDGGGCMGYGGIPNSLALELDSYQNSYDPDNNHMALQNCGAGLANSPDHATCNVSLNGQPAFASNPLSSASLSNAQTAVTLADGNVHQIVVVYSGPLESTPNLFQVYLDPAFVTGTHTPVPGSIPVFSGTYDLTTALNLLNSGGANDSAYVGFTAATGYYFENNELMGWTFTPHTTVSQEQPLNPPGTPTTYDFGTHSYTTNFPSGTSTSDITMGVIANTITPAQFTSLLGLGPTQYTGSACQVYDDTGGKCIIYSVYCYFTDSEAPTACPAPSSPPTDCSDTSATDCINLTSSYNNSVQPVSPGYLQGDPLFSPISSITTSGTTATVTCLGECAVTANQTVTVLDANDNPVASNVTVLSAPAVNQFTFTASSPISQTGGFLTSNNVQDIFVSYSPQNIDGSTAGHTKNFSDFVVTAVTNIGSQIQLSAPNNSVATVNQPVLLTATLNIPATVPENGIPANLLTLLPAGSPGLTVGGTVSFFEGANTTPIEGCDSVPLTLNNPSYQATCSYTPTSTGPVTITAQYSGDAYHQGSSNSLTLTVNAASTVSISPSSIDFGTLYLGSIVTKTVSIRNTGVSSLSITGPRIAIVGGGDSREFVTLNLCPRSLAAGRSCLMTVTFIAGPFYTPQTAVLTINDSSPDSPQTVPLTATVINPRVRLSSSRLNFGTHRVGTSTTAPLTITNVGATDLSIANISITGADVADFSAPNTCPATLPAGNSCTLAVTFTPQARRGRSAVLVITDNAQGSPQSVLLSGAGN